MRGGKREGAGRKPLFALEECIEIGSRCDRLATEKARADLESKIDAKYDADDRARSLEAIHAAPANAKRKSDGKAARQVALELSQGNVPEGGYPEVVLEAARHLKDRRETLDGAGGLRPVGRHFSLKRAYGHRQEIVSEVAAWASQKFGRVISPDQVDSCWKEYRRLFRPETDDIQPPV